MTEIKSNVEVARENVKTFIDMELSKVEIDFLNVTSIIRILKLNNDFGKLMVQYDKDVEHLAHLVIDITEQKIL